MIEILVEEYQDLEELFWKVKLPDLPAVIVDSDSKQSIKSGLRKTLKPDSFKEISIDRVTKSEKRKMHLALAKGMDDEEQVDEDVPTNSASSGAIAMPADAVRRKKKKYGGRISLLFARFTYFFAFGACRAAKSHLPKAIF